MPQDRDYVKYCSFTYTPAPTATFSVSNATINNSLLQKMVGDLYMKKPDDYQSQLLPDISPDELDRILTSTSGKENI